MYLHLGQNVVVPEKNLIGIFDLDNTTGSQITRTFLRNAEKEGRVLNVSDELPRSFVVSSDANSKSNNILISQLTPQTLLKRMEANLDSIR